MKKVKTKMRITDKLAFLRLFLPRNFSRVTPLAYVFWGAFVSLFIGLLFYKQLLFLGVIGGLILAIFVLAAYFYKNPLI